MTSPKNEFLVGCLLGGVLGAAAAFLVNKKIEHAPHKRKRHAHHASVHHEPKPLKTHRKPRAKKATK